MGICLSRRAMQAGSNEHAAAEAEAVPAGKLRNRHEKVGNEADMINPARLLLESPRISTGEMGMLGLFFQKKYCKPLQHHQQQQHGHEKLTPMEKKTKAECELGVEADMASSGILKGATMMTANVLFEKDEYPTFEPNSRAAATGQGAAESVVVAAVAAGRVENEEDARRSKDSSAVNEGGGGCSRGDQMWASAGEDFFSDWEDRSERGSSGIRGSTSAAGAPEIGVFEAEQYFKEEPRASDGSCFYDASNNNNNDDEGGGSTSEALLRPNKQPAEASRSSELKRPSSGAAKSPSSSGSSGIRWASSCTAASAVQIDGEAFVDHGRTLRRAKSKAELQLSKMFKLLGSSSSSSQVKHKPRSSMATTTSSTTGKRQQQQHRSNENAKPSKSSKIRESHVKDWMDKARKSSDGIFALGQEEDQQRCDQKPLSNNEQQHADPNLLRGSPANAAAHHHRPEHSATGGQPVGFTFSGTTDSSAAGALNESATNTHNQGFGSPLPASANSDQKQQQQAEEPRIVVSAVASSSTSRDRLPVRPRPRAKTRKHEEVVVVEGDESDSSSDLFELDSVTTSLSSARSSLSRLSSARSSIRKSTADEQDLLHLQFGDNKAVLAATLRANVLESTPAAAARAALACNAEDAAAENATKNHDSLRERVSSISLTDSQSIIGSRGGSAAAAAAAAAGGGGITTANEENKPPPPTNRRAKGEILLSSSRHSLNARSVAPWNNSNGVLAVQT